MCEAVQAQSSRNATKLSSAAYALHTVYTLSLLLVSYSKTFAALDLQQVDITRHHDHQCTGSRTVYIRYTKGQQRLCCPSGANLGSKRKGYVFCLRCRSMRLCRISFHCTVQVLTPDEFVTAGDYLSRTYPNWEW